MHTDNAINDSFSIGDWILCASNLNAIWGPSCSLSIAEQNAETASVSGSLCKGLVALAKNK